MPYVDEMLECLKENRIRSGVISNIGWSGHALKERINRLLPKNQFEFIIASSDYGIRKPNSMLFELAMQKANLPPDEIWFCGDNVKADVFGARNVGIFPVFYEDESVENPYMEQKNLKIDFEHFHIHGWSEMIEILNS